MQISRKISKTYLMSVYIFNDTVSDTQFYPSKTCQHKDNSMMIFGS